MDQLQIQDGHFVDSEGRRVILRGVNLSGSSKVPIGQETQIANNFAAHRQVSFVGRPFPLAEAHEHYARLRHWGFNLLRLIITWEAIEHAGPGAYDEDYLSYLQEIVALAGEYGFYVYIDPHQDAWSRMTGGDGAPGWTLEAAGFDLKTLELSEAAITMQRRYPEYPHMIWPTNYVRLAGATMFTLFFAGNRFASETTIDGKMTQEYLQSHYINAMVAVAKRLKDMPHVLGYGTMNEPASGYIGLASLTDTGPFPQQGPLITFGEGILLGAGHAREAPIMALNGLIPHPTGEMVTLNPQGISAWQSPDHDIWRKQGVWGYDDEGQPAILLPDYFAEGDFAGAGLAYFAKQYAAAMQAVHPNAMIFYEGPPFDANDLALSDADIPNIVNAGHWYDVLMLFAHQFDGEQALNPFTMELVEGRENVAQMFTEAVGSVKRTGTDNMHNAPTLIGEFGVMYSINDRSAYSDGDFSLHELALSLYYDAMDANLVSSAQWNYTPDHTNQWGDNWNREDLSIFSRDAQTNPEDINSGARALVGFCRPYVQRAAGDLRRMHFDATDGTFTVDLLYEGAEAPTLIYLPHAWYGEADYKVKVSSGKHRILDARQGQILEWKNLKVGEQTLTVSLPKGASLPKRLAALALLAGAGVAANRLRKELTESDAYG